jgi:hypothetical protein
MHRGAWVGLAEMADDYQGTVLREFVHPLLVRFDVLYSPVTGVGGPPFHLEFTVTPDGVLVTLRCLGRARFGLTIPLLEDDGRPLETVREGPILSTRYPGKDDVQAFLLLDEDSQTETGDAVMSAYGLLRPVRVTAPGDSISVFVYPHGAGDPPARAVLDSFRLFEGGFESMLGAAGPREYRGRHSAGGLVEALDVNGDGETDLTFPEPCGVLVQRNHDGTWVVEVDRPVTATIAAGKEYALTRHTPVSVP